MLTAFLLFEPQYLICYPRACLTLRCGSGCPAETIADFLTENSALQVENEAPSWQLSLKYLLWFDPQYLLWSGGAQNSY